MSVCLPYPINYDFGANWKTKIVPHLDSPRVQKALRSGINRYLSGFPGNKKYKVDTCPANYSSNDGYAMLMDRKGEIFMEDLLKNNKLPQEYVLTNAAIYQSYLDLKAKLDDDDDLFIEVMEMEEELQKDIHEWHNIKYDLESYFLSGSCYSYAPTFELTLAKVVEPNEVWRVRVGEKHATVISKDKTKVFDLLYWAALGGRLDNYVFGDELTDIDPTLGGKDAYLDSQP